MFKVLVEHYEDGMSGRLHVATQANSTNWKFSHGRGPLVFV